MAGSKKNDAVDGIPVSADPTDGVHSQATPSLKRRRTPLRSRIVRWKQRVHAEIDSNAIFGDPGATKLLAVETVSASRGSPALTMKPMHPGNPRHAATWSIGVFPKAATAPLNPMSSASSSNDTQSNIVNVCVLDVDRGTFAILDPFPTTNLLG
jgi:hypothetical protein